MWSFASTGRPPRAARRNQGNRSKSATSTVSTIIIIFSRRWQTANSISDLVCFRFDIPLYYYRTMRVMLKKSMKRYMYATNLSISFRVQPVSLSSLSCLTHAVVSITVLHGFFRRLTLYTRGVLPYISCIGMCRPKGYGF